MTVVTPYERTADAEHDGFARPLTDAELGRMQESMHREMATEFEVLRHRIPEPVNEAHAQTLNASYDLRFRDRVFIVPPVPAPAGIAIQGIYRRLERAKESAEDAAGLQALLDLMVETVDLFWQLIQPATLWDRLFWRHRSNPFLDATEGEIAVLLHFFHSRRMMSGVSYQMRPTGRSRQPTASTTSAASPPPAPAGATGPVRWPGFRSRGGTSGPARR